MSLGLANPSGARGANPTPTRQQSCTDPMTRSRRASGGEERGPDARHGAETPLQVTSDTAALCLPVVVRLKAVTSQPTYLRPSAIARPGPLAPPA